MYGSVVTLTTRSRNPVGSTHEKKMSVLPLLYYVHCRFIKKKLNVIITYFLTVRWQHGGAVVSTVASQQLHICPGRFCVELASGYSHSPKGFNLLVILNCS